jgi:hypothetical protein
MGEGESVTIERPFHIYERRQVSRKPESSISNQRGERRTMNAVDNTRPKLRIWAAACRGFPKLESIVGSCVRVAAN